MMKIHHFYQFTQRTFKAGAWVWVSMCILKMRCIFRAALDVKELQIEINLWANCIRTLWLETQQIHVQLRRNKLCKQTAATENKQGNTTMKQQGFPNSVQYWASGHGDGEENALLEFIWIAHEEILIFTTNYILKYQQRKVQFHL